MNKEMNVAVFESDDRNEMELIKSKLDQMEIISQILPIDADNENIYLTSQFLLKVNLIDEAKTLELIDNYLQQH